MRSSLRHVLHRHGVLWCAVAATAFVVLGGVPITEAANLLVQPTDVQMTRQDGVVTITARVRVRNYEFQPLEGLAVVGAEEGPLKGQTVYIGSVPPEGEAVSDGVYSFSVDLKKTPYGNMQFPVTLQYTFNGENTEVVSGLSHSFVNVPE